MCPKLFSWAKNKRKLFFRRSRGPLLARAALQEILMSKWHLVQQQPLPREIFNEPPIYIIQKGAFIQTYS